MDKIRFLAKPLPCTNLCTAISVNKHRHDQTHLSTHISNTRRYTAHLKKGEFVQQHILYAHTHTHTHTHRCQVGEVDFFNYMQS